jgi:hypothetical protein
MKIELETPEPETVRLDLLPKGAVFVDDGEFYMRVSSTKNLAASYTLTVNLGTGEHRATQNDVQVVPVAITGAKAKKLKLQKVAGSAERFIGLDGPA